MLGWALNLGFAGSEPVADVPGSFHFNNFTAAIRDAGSHTETVSGSGVITTEDPDPREGDDTTVVFTIGADAVGAAYITIGNAKIQNSLVAGRLYAVSATIKSITNWDTGTKIFDVNGTNSTEGTTDMFSPAGLLAGDRIGTVFDYQSGTPNVRIGCPANYTPTGTDGVLKLRDFMLEDVTDASSQSPGPMCRALETSNLNRAYTSTMTNTYDGKVTLTYGANEAVTPPRLAYLVGDSFANSGNDWPAELNTLDESGYEVNGNFGFNWQGYNGQKIAGIDAHMRTMFTQTDEFDRSSEPEIVVANGGINDVNQASSDPNSTMQSNIASMVAFLLDKDIFPILINTSPYGNHVGYTAEKEGWRTTYNAWLESYCTTNGYGFVDIQTLLQDSGDSTILDASYDSGDGLHPNQDGAILIAKAVWDEIQRLIGLDTFPFTTPSQVGGVGVEYSKEYLDRLKRRQHANLLIDDEEVAVLLLAQLIRRH